MDAKKQEIRLVLRAATVEEIAPLIAMAGPFHCDGWPFDAKAVAAGGERFVFERDGMPVCGYVLVIQGREVYIQAAGASEAIDFTKIGLQAIEAQAANFESVSFMTKRKGLVRKAERLGYEVDGYILRKKIKK